MLFKVVSALALVSVAMANPQYYGPPDTGSTPSSSAAPAPSSAASSSSSAQVLVQVGESGFTFSPSDIQASVGTLVTFVFPSSIQHSVTQSNFANPCSPLANGFDSGYVINGDTYSINVTDASTPIYFFCKFPAHCGLGMVGTINAPSSGSGSNAAFVSAASALGSNEPIVSFTGFTTGGVGAVATAGPTAGTPSVAGGAAPTSSGSSPSPSPSASSGSGSGSSNGASSLSVGSTVGVVGVVAAVFGMLL